MKRFPLRSACVGARKCNEALGAQALLSRDKKCSIRSLAARFGPHPRINTSGSCEPLRQWKKPELVRFRADVVVSLGVLPD